MHTPDTQDGGEGSTQYTAQFVHDFIASRRAGLAEGLPPLPAMAVTLKWKSFALWCHRLGVYTLMMTLNGELLS